jgi:hypothetical protein
MNRLLGALKATYNFFSGDAITLTTTIIAFIVCGLLSGLIGHFMHAPSLVIALILIGAIVGSLIATLLREVGGRPHA